MTPTPRQIEIIRAALIKPIQYIKGDHWGISEDVKWRGREVFICEKEGWLAPVTENDLKAPLQIAEIGRKYVK